MVLAEHHDRDVDGRCCHRAGTGVVLRGGKAYPVRWSRPDADGGTTFTTMSGQVMTFARGPVWVVLAAAP